MYQPALEEFALPTYTIRESKRAKRIILKFMSAQELEIVIPQGFDRRLLSTLLREKRPWLKATAERLARQAQKTGQTTEELPTAIFLRAINQEWQVIHQQSHYSHLTLSEKESSLLLKGGLAENKQAAQWLLKQWVKEKAELYLIPWLTKVAVETGLSYQKATIRAQKTRWGSYSARNNISLNCKLLFLPPPLVRYVLLHELCHTRHLNHSPEFWGLVASLEPQSAQYLTELRKAVSYLPAWLVID